MSEENVVIVELNQAGCFTLFLVFMLNKANLTICWWKRQIHNRETLNSHG